jgi:hypothetical protein
MIHRLDEAARVVGLQRSARPRGADRDVAREVVSVFGGDE